MRETDSVPLSVSHYVNNQEILQEQVRNVVFGRRPKKQVDSRVNFEDLNVQRELSVLKPVMQLGWWKCITFSPARNGGFMS